VSLLNLIIGLMTNVAKKCKHWGSPFQTAIKLWYSLHSPQILQTHQQLLFR
jgi:hypothetical protein